VNDGVDALRTWAGQVGVDQTKFNQCLDSGQHAQFVRDEAKEAENEGVKSTPSILVNGKLLVGASGGPPTLEEIAAAVGAVASGG